MEIERWVAFSDDPAGGNPAGVALVEQPLDDATMLAVAAEVGFSETAFLLRTGPGRFTVRYFAPEAEVPFCGHATIASAVALAARDDALASVTLDSPVGEVAVRIERDGDGVRAELTSPAASVVPLSDEDLDALLAAFAWSHADLDPALPPAVGHGGGYHPVLALRDRATLAGMTYDFDALRALMELRSWTTIQVVWRRDERTFDARDPFPVGGVVEDPATGAAAAALGAYLRGTGSLPDDGRFVIHQGTDMGRPSVLRVDASGTGGVRVSGRAVVMP